MIANGGSANTRDSPINTYQGIRNFWKETGADSVMIARAAEWNPSVFSPNGKSDIYQIVDKYLDYAIKYDQPFIISKYNIQQHLGGDQVMYQYHQSQKIKKKNPGQKKLVKSNKSIS